MAYHSEALLLSVRGQPLLGRVKNYPEDLGSEKIHLCSSCPVSVCRAARFTGSRMRSDWAWVVLHRMMTSAAATTIHNHAVTRRESQDNAVCVLANTF